MVQVIIERDMKGIPVNGPKDMHYQTNQLFMLLLGLLKISSSAQGLEGRACATTTKANELQHLKGHV